MTKSILLLNRRVLGNSKVRSFSFSSIFMKLLNLRYQRKSSDTNQTRHHSIHNIQLYTVLKYYNENVCTITIIN